MDWWQEALSFPTTNSTRVRDFAPAQDMQRAIAQYNRAVRNLRADSMDIALIALRSLAATYPQFAQAVLLYGCCQMAIGNLRTGHEVFARAQSDRFTERFRVRTEEYRAAAQADLQQMAAEPQHEEAAEPTYHLHPTAPLIQRGSFSRPPWWSRLVRVRRGGAASVSEHARAPRVREPLTMRFPALADWRRWLLGVAALALVGLLVFGVVRLLGGGSGRKRPPVVSDHEKLAWLLTALADDAASDRAHVRTPQELLDAYQHLFPAAGGPLDGVQPSPGPSVEPTPSTATLPAATVPPTPALPTPAPTAPPPTATPSPTTAPDYEQTLRLAQDMLATARDDIHTQPLTAYRLLHAMDDLLADLPADARIAGDGPDVDALRTARADLIAANEWHLCESHRVAAEAPWQRRDYATCLPLYEAVYQINPVYYTGYCAFRLGLCYEQVGAFAQALACYRTVETIGPASPQYTGALARMAALG